MKKMLLVIMSIMLLIISVDMSLAETDASIAEGDTLISIPQNIVLSDGSTITKNTAKSMDINNNFHIESSADMIDVGDIRETKEWGYANPGFDIITSVKELEILSEEYVCMKDSTVKTVVASAGLITVSDVSNPYCVYYPKKLIVKGEDDDSGYTNLVNISQPDKYTVRVDYPFENYDPTIVNYSGNCSNAGGCTVNAATYSVDITYGSIRNLKAIVSDRPNLDWCIGDTTASCSSIYAGGWMMDPATAATCAISQYTDYLYMNCSNVYVEQHFYFYNTYIKTELTAFNTSYRYYWFTTLMAGNASVYTDSGILAPGARWTDSDGPNGVAGVAVNTTVADNSSNTTYILAISWNQSIETDFDYGAGVDNSGIAPFRGSNAPANVWTTAYIKFISRNESQASMTGKYTSALNAFKNDVNYGDSYAINYSGDCSDIAYIVTPYYNVTLTEGVINSFVYHKLTDFDFAAGGNASNIGQVWETSMRQSPTIDSNCTLLNYADDELKLRINSVDAEADWTFYPTYIRRDSTSYSGILRDYFYTQYVGMNATAFNSSQELTNVTVFANVKDGRGVAGIRYSQTSTPYIFAVAWNESRTVYFGYQAGGGGLAGIAIGRGGEILANASLTSYIKIIPENISATGTDKVTTALIAFNNNPSYGDAETATESEARAIIDDVIESELSNATIETDVVVYVVSQNGSQYLGIVDKLASSGSKRWGFNYLTGSDSWQTIVGISGSLYFWQNESLTSSQISQQVGSFINGTK